MSLWKKILIIIAVIAVALSLINASWIAGAQPGRLVVVAQRGIVQPTVGSRQGGCDAARIRPPEENLYIENSLPSLYKATRLGADAVSVDVRRTRDGQMVLFRDPTLDCRTNGKGALADRTLAELKALDIGWGYTADGGRTFPLRGRGIGGMPTVEEALREVWRTRIVFNLRGTDPADADALVAAFSRAAVKIDDKYSFHGRPAVLARLKSLVPRAWTYGEAELESGCLADYKRIGWLGFVPASCRGATVAVPLNGQWTLWGWPNRFQARMGGAGARQVMFERYSGGEIVGLRRPEQLGEVPRDFRGHVFIEDFYNVGRALRR